jgi:hypothetical protein
MRRLLIAVAAVTMLAGCSGAPDPTTAESTAPASTSEASAPEQPIDPEGIESMDEGIAWARALDDSVTAEQLSSGIDRITGHLLDEEIDFETSNEIGQALMALDGEISSAPDTAGSRVADLEVIVDRIEAATAAS